MKVDKDTDKVIKEGEALRAMSESDGWKIAKSKLYSKVNDLNSVLGLEAKDPEALIRETGAKQLATTILLDWIREVEGGIHQYKSHREALEKIQEESHIKYFSESIEQYG